MYLYLGKVGLYSAFGEIGSSLDQYLEIRLAQAKSLFRKCAYPLTPIHCAARCTTTRQGKNILSRIADLHDPPSWREPELDSLHIMYFEIGYF